ncbi:DUF982 domain-containing protein [Aquibium sp. LZ166]|uniref:DUF982 domain-containing protein n=1 Tax=Aquibium pacificus TaxID=3153579 RepID=A0ABV3SL87_9HYPH
MAREFSDTVKITAPSGTIEVASAQEAYEVLSDPDWPKRGPAHGEAVETALKVMDGHRSTVDAYDTFVRAAKEAGNLVER